jgi:hypothetical protein
MNVTNQEERNELIDEQSLLEWMNTSSPVS